MGRVTLTLPRLGETMEEARVTDWLVAPGTAFRRGEVLLEVETDKTVVEVPALTDGVLVAQLVAPGDVVALDQAIAEVEVAGASDAVPPAASSGGPPPPSPPHGGEGSRAATTAAPGSTVATDGVPETRRLPSPPWGGDGGGGLAVGDVPPARPRASPAARATAVRLGADLNRIPGTGRNGRITAADVSAANGPVGPVALHRTPGPGTPVVLLHGLFDDHRGWRDLPRRLSALGHAVLAADLPGHGDSAPAATLDAAEAALLAALPDGLLRLVGHSLGAALATRLALHLGDRVERMVLLAPAGLGNRINADFLDGMLAAETPQALARALALLAAGPLSAPLLAQELHRLQARREGQRTLADATARHGIQQTDIAADLARLSCPVTVVFGTSDRILDWRDVAALPPRVAVHLIRDAGHLPHAADPGLIADLVAAPLPQAALPQQRSVQP